MVIFHPVFQGSPKVPVAPHYPERVIKWRLRHSSVPIMLKPARILTFKCAKCAKAVKVFLQKVSACSHIQPYQGICDCGEVKRHATGNGAAVASYLASTDEAWMHHH
jgi:hypothetical protein